MMQRTGKRAQKRHVLRRQLTRVSSASCLFDRARKILSGTWNVMLGCPLPVTPGTAIPFGHCRPLFLLPSVPDVTASSRQAEPRGAGWVRAAPVRTSAYRPRLNTWARTHPRQGAGPFGWTLSGSSASITRYGNRSPSMFPSLKPAHDQGREYGQAGLRKRPIPRRRPSAARHQIENAKLCAASSAK
jgi:hypothetical protein